MACCWECVHYDPHVGAGGRTCGYERWAYSRPCKEYEYERPTKGYSDTICHICGEIFNTEFSWLGSHAYRCPKCRKIREQRLEKIKFDRHWKSCQYCTFFFRVNPTQGICSIGMPKYHSNDTPSIIITKGITGEGAFERFESFSFDEQCNFYSFTYESFIDGKKIKRWIHLRNYGWLYDNQESMSPLPPSPKGKSILEVFLWK